jgi:hypothetical protein
MAKVVSYSPPSRLSARGTEYAAFTPNKDQAKMIELALRKEGVTRAEVRKALKYPEGANVPIQMMLKDLAARCGYEFVTEEAPNPNTESGLPWIGVYAFRKAPIMVAAMSWRAERKVASKKAPRKTAKR